MSRTKKGTKAPGYDFWTPRPGNIGGGGSGPFAKYTTHKKERKQNNREARADNDIS